MESQITSFLSLETIVFSLVVYIVCQIFRTLIEKTISKLTWSFITEHTKTHIKDFWNEAFLPMLPIITGGVAAYFLPTYPYPSSFSTTLTSRIFFGIIAGVMSGMVYKTAKFYLRKNLPDNMKKKYSAVMGEIDSEEEDSDKLAVPNPTEQNKQ